MLKIIEVHASDRVECEYVVLQNLGLVTINLRGWALSTEIYLQGDMERMTSRFYVFREEISIKPYTRVVLFSGAGEDGWVPTVDGRQAYCAYWNREQTIWTAAENVLLLQVLAQWPVNKTSALSTSVSF